MDCREANIFLSAYLDGELPAWLAGQMAEHVEGCYLCQEEAAELASLLTIGREAARCPDDSDGLGPLLTEIARIEDHRRNAKISRARVVARTRRLATAAIFMLLIAPCWPLFQRSGQLLAMLRTPEAASGERMLDLVRGSGFRPAVKWLDLIERELPPEPELPREIVARHTPEAPPPQAWGNQEDISCLFFDTTRSG